MAKIFITGGAYQGKCRYAKEHYDILESEILDFGHIDLQALNGYNPENEMIDLLLEQILKFACDTISGKVHCFYNCHCFVRWAVERKANVIELWERLLLKLGVSDNWCVIMDEIGNGIVPMDKFDREYREQVGSFGCYIAGNADEVLRIVCGIGNRIK